MIEEFEYNGKAMGTEYFVTVVCNSRIIANKINIMVKKNIEDYEKKFSRFLTTSELSILNKNKKMVVSPVFLEVTLRAYQLFIKTKGIFNPLVSISRLGYDKNFNEIKNDKMNEINDIYDIDFSTVIIDKEKSIISLNEGQNLDYGGFLKGYLAELIVKKIKMEFEEVSGIIINLGGDIYTEGLDKDGKKFIFNIYNPILNNNDINVTLYNQGLATSGTYKRSWINSGEKVHHILDIFGKKNPETDIISSSVICDSGGEAEAYTKVFMSMDNVEARQLLDNKDIQFIIIKNNNETIKSII